jgi:hypothetical protein
MRFRIEPRDVPPAAAARRLGKTFAEFDAALPDPTGGSDDRQFRSRRLVARGFPRDAKDVVQDRLAKLKAGLSRG